MDAHIQYLLDGAVELGRLTALEHACLFYLQACQDELEQIVDSDELVNDRLRGIAHKHLQRCSQPIRHLLALAGAPVLPHALRALRERMEHEVQQRVQHDLGVAPSALHELRCMLGTQADANPEPVFPSPEDVRHDTVQGYALRHFAPLLQRWAANVQDFRQAAQWFASLTPDAQRVQLQALRQLMRKTSVSVEHVANGLSIRELAGTGKAATAARPAIKKALKLFDRLGKTEDVRMLVAGEEVTLSHASSPFKFVLKAYENNWLHELTQKPRRSAPFDIHLLTKDDVHLARLCVYMDNTPVLDQLLALAMFVESGQENLLLEKANWFGLSDPTQTSEEPSQRPRLAKLLLKHCPEALPRAGFLPDGTSKPKASPAAARDRRLLSVMQEHEQWEPYRGPVRAWLQSLLEQQGLTWSEQDQQILVAWQPQEQAA